MAAAKDLGPLDWKAPIVDSQGRPSPEFQRRWNLQRNNNALIGTITFGVVPPTGTPQDGAEYVNTATTPYTVFLGKGGSWHQAGAVAFTDLDDVPHTYAAHGLALLRVKATADGVEFATQSAALDSLGAPANGQLLQRAAGLWALVTLSTVLDTISSTRGTVLFRGAAAWSALAPGVAGNVLATAGAGADPSWVAPGGGGSSFGYEASPTVPVLANFTLLNAGTATLTAGVGGLRLDVPGSATNMRLAKLNAGPPATPYTLKARVVPLPPLASGAYPGGVFFMNSVSGKILFWGRFQNQVLSQSWTNFTTFNANVISPTNTSGGAYFPWFGLKNDGTTVSFLTSADGKDWYTLGTTQTLASFLISVDTVGFGSMSNGPDAGCVCQSFAAV